MPSHDETGEGRRWLRIAAAALLALATLVAVLALAGVFSGDDDREPRLERPAQAPPATRAPERSSDELPLELSTVRVGGRPTAVAAGDGAVWVADSFAARGTLLESESRRPDRVSFALDGPAADVTVDGDGAWFALPEQQIVERRDPEDPDAGGETIELDGFPSVVAAGEDAVWVLSDRFLQRIDPASGAEEPVGVGGFASSVAAGEDGVWVVVDNRELVRIDPGAKRREGDPLELPEPFGVAVGEGGVWVLSATGEVTRVDPDSLRVSSAPERVRGALDLAAGHGRVWVTAANRTVTRLDPETLEQTGEPLRVGDEAASVSVGERAVWIANGGDGTLTRIDP